MNPDGTGQTNLTRNGAADETPVWSPDGAKIAFVTSRDGNNTQIYVMAANGANQTALTTDNTATNYSPAWSPDGSKIAFVSDRDGPGGDIYVMGANGSNPTRLTQNAGYPMPCPSGRRTAARSPS